MNMTHLQNNQVREDKAHRYATRDDFCQVFSEELDGLYQLSFLATGDHDKAERCILASLEDCCRANHVFRDWALSWAKRTIIRYAILELQRRPQPDKSSWAKPDLRFGGKLSHACGSYIKAKDVLALEDFERIVFVISVLERYSDRDCAVLLACSGLEIRESRRLAHLHIWGSRTANQNSTWNFDHADALSSSYGPHMSLEPRYRPIGGHPVARSIGPVSSAIVASRSAIDKRESDAETQRLQ
jgi:hypothetical protein